MKKNIYVLYDGDCGMCKRMLGRIQALDILHRLTPVNLRDRAELERLGLGRLSADLLEKDMHVIQDEKVWRGYEAYRKLASHLPALWAVWPFLWIWPVTAIGRAVYRRVAESRSLRPSDWFGKGRHCKL